MNTNSISTLRQPQISPLDRAAHAVGVALVSWSERSARREDQQQRLATSAVPRTRELHDLRRAAQNDSQLIAARRDLGINQLLG